MAEKLKNGDLYLWQEKKFQTKQRKKGKRKIVGVTGHIKNFSYLFVWLYGSIIRKVRMSKTASARRSLSMLLSVYEEKLDNMEEPI